MVFIDSDQRPARRRFAASPALPAPTLLDILVELDLLAASLSDLTIPRVTEFSSSASMPLMYRCSESRRHHHSSRGHGKLLKLLRGPRAEGCTHCNRNQHSHTRGHQSLAGQVSRTLPTDRRQSRYQEQFSQGRTTANRSEPVSRGSLSPAAPARSAGDD